VIPNPVGYKRCSAPSPKQSPERLLVTLGRLSPQKQFDYLLRAFERCGSRHPEWSLQIIGEGPDRQRLEALAADLGIGRRVRFSGVVPEPETILCEADLFVLTSRYEGFPNALLEAMACGLPVVSFDCPSGPREIIRDGIDGLLVPAQDVDALTTAMDRLMADQEGRRALGRRALEVTERFGIDRVMAMWDSVITECVEKSRSRGSGCEREFA
jgi:GalNAc-alpha-(1->4)-GalNAc-alpha-(1->3)-diNAcBac-PP-undecaprenol alpha-1,4-N-acetyl-D-galactosaminyltransferase